MRTASAFLRFALVGVASNLGGYAAYLLVTWLGVAPKLAMSILYGIGAAIGYLGNRRWSFRHRGSIAASLPRYGLAHLLGYGINYLMLAWFADRLGHPHQLVQAAAIIVVAVFLFLAFRFFVFAPVRAGLPQR